MYSCFDTQQFLFLGVKSIKWPNYHDYQVCKEGILIRWWVITVMTSHHINLHASLSLLTEVCNQKILRLVMDYCSRRQFWQKSNQKAHLSFLSLKWMREKQAIFLRRHALILKSYYSGCPQYNLIEAWPFWTLTNQLIIHTKKVTWKNKELMIHWSGIKSNFG